MHRRAVLLFVFHFFPVRSANYYPCIMSLTNAHAHTYRLIEGVWTQLGAELLLNMIHLRFEGEM